MNLYLPQRCARLSLLFGLLCSDLPEAGAGGVPVSPDDAMTDVFRAFLIKPPVIEGLVFTRKNLLATTGREAKQEIRWYHVSYESPERFAAKVYYSPEIQSQGGGFETPVMCYSASGERWWYTHTLSNLVVVHLWHTRTPADVRYNTVLQAINAFRREHLDTVLGLGITYLVRQNVIWAGDQYHFTNHTERVDASGYLLRDESGRPETVFHTFSTWVPAAKGGEEWRTYRYRVEYQYNIRNNVPPYLPTTITSTLLLSDARELPVEEIQVFLLKLSDRPLSPEALDFESTITGRPFRIHVVSNKAEFTLVDNRWIKVPGPDDPRFIGHRVEPRSMLLQIFTGVFLLAPIIALILMNRRAKHSSDKQNT